MHLGWAKTMWALLTRDGAVRWALFFLAWLALGRVQPLDLAAGAIISALAAALSLSLLPAGGGRLNLRAVLAYIMRFVAGAVRAGWDVARRVAATPPDVRPGIVQLACPIPEGLARDTFRALTSLQPGMLPLAARGPELEVHCLDVDTPVAEAIETDARAFLAMKKAEQHG